MRDIDPDRLNAVRRDWLSGMLSVRLMRIKHGFDNDADIEMLAAQHNWPARPTMQQRIEDETARALVDRAVSAEHAAHGVGIEPTLIDDDVQVAAYAQQVASVVESQRSAVEKGRKLADAMLDELAAIQPPKVDNEAIKTLANAIQDRNPALAQHLREHVGAVSPAQQMSFLSRRIGMLRTVSEAHERYISLERQAWGLDAQKADPTDFDAVLNALESRRATG